jgi:hypothetical protein
VSGGRRCELANEPIRRRFKWRFVGAENPLVTIAADVERRRRHDVSAPRLDIEAPSQAASTVADCAPVRWRQIDVQSIAAGAHAPGVGYHVELFFKRGETLVTAMPWINVDNDKPRGAHSDVELRVLPPPFPDYRLVEG